MSNWCGMYNRDQPLISGWARACPENFAFVISFAIISARVHFSNMPRFMREFKKLGLGAPCVRQSVKYEGVRRMMLAEERTSVFSDCERLYLAGDYDALLTRLYGVYGLGFAKAGFVAQLVYGVSGCLDSHNLRRFGIGARKYQSRQYAGESAKRALERATDYNRTIALWGGTRALWDGWVDYIARQYPEDYLNASHVSRIHVDATVGAGS